MKMPASTSSSTLPRRALAEFIGTALLVAAVIGSGIAASRLSPGDVGLQLFENAAATAGALIAVIVAIGPVSGAHLNPVVSFADWRLGGISGVDALAYTVAQVAGGIAGAVSANLMFALPALELSVKLRWGAPLWFGEIIATFGLLLVIFGGVRSGRGTLVPISVGAYIGGAYWFTSSTSFANPAVTIARTLSNTFAGIAPGSAAPFIAAQVAGALVAVTIIRTLYPAIAEVAGKAVLPRVE